jgi:hypothetical protein
MCWDIWMTVNSWVSVLNVVLLSVSSALWCTVWKVLCFCAQYTFLMYRLECVLFLCTVQISEIPSGKCSISVHSTLFWCTVRKVFCFCAQYTFLLYRLESVRFLCTVHISDIPSGKCSFSAHISHFCRPVMWYFCKYSTSFYRCKKICVARTASLWFYCGASSSSSCRNM